MNVVNSIMDALMAALGYLPPEAALAAFSVLTALAALALFKVASRPERIAVARDRALARVMELWLWREDAVGGLFSVGRAMAASLIYFSVMLRPLAVSLVPMALLLVQAHEWFGPRSLRQGEAVMVVVRAERAGVVEGLALAAEGGGLRVEASVATPEACERVWRVRAGQTDGTFRLRLSGAGVDDVKRLCVDGGLRRVTAQRGRGFWNRVLYPGEAPLRGAVEHIGVAYPVADYNYFGIRADWLTALLALSLCAGLALKKPMRVEF